MQLLFLFCTMLIIKSEAFCQKLRGDRRSASFKRKTSRFPQRLKYPVSRYMFRDSNIPLSVAPFTFEISQYEAPNFIPLRIRPHKFEKYFPQKKKVNKRLRRHFLRNDCKFSTYSIFKPPQCFENYQFPRSSFRHFRNLIDLQKVRNSKLNSLKRRHQCLPNAYVPFNYKNSRSEPRKLIKQLKEKHKRYSNFKKQCLSDMDVETESSASKTNATNNSTSDEESEIDKSDNHVVEKLENSSASPKSNSLPPTNKNSTSVTFTSQKIEYPDDVKRYDLSYFESDNPIPNIREKEGASEISNEAKTSFEENIAEDLSKLKHMVNDVEKAFKEHKKKTLKHSEKEKPEKKAKKSVPEKILNNATVESMQLKEKIDKMAIPILNQISEELGKRDKIMESASNTSIAAESKAANETAKKKFDDHKERCNPDGTWLSTTMKMDLTFTMQPNMMIKVKVKPNKESLINGKWSLQGLTLSKRGGPFIFAGLYPQGRKVVSFLGQCKISKEEDFIFGIWTLFRFSRKYTDLWKSVETKLDVLTKKDSKSEKKKKKKKKDKE